MEDQKMEDDNSQLSIKDHFAIEAMKVLLQNTEVLINFAAPAQTGYYTSEKAKINAKILVEACYTIAFAMRKARLGAFE